MTAALYIGVALAFTIAAAVFLTNGKVFLAGVFAVLTLAILVAGSSVGALGQGGNILQGAADLQPRVIREVDGCKVYAFKSSAEGRWHYFTRCPGERTTTDTTNTVRSGKTTRQETTQIVTEAGK